MKTALVTGANRGLGKGFVEYLVSIGYVVFAGVRKPDSVIATDKVIQVELDISSDESIKETFKYISSKTKSLDIIVNNAGVNKESATNNNKELVSKLGKLDRKSLNHMFDVNAVSPLILTKEFLPILLSNPSFVINISSCRASFNDEYPNSSGNYGYRASKSALSMLTFCSVMDLPKNVKTFSVHPGDVKTDMNEDGTDLPFDQAKKILDITKTWKDEMNGRFLRYDGTYYP
jgi:NAD(P)-dependent dehydrogenase (short-subunit alcohol dehydrogenase family)